MLSDKTNPGIKKSFYLIRGTKDCGKDSRTKHLYTRSGFLQLLTPTMHSVNVKIAITSHSFASRK